MSVAVRWGWARTVASCGWYSTANYISQFVDLYPRGIAVEVIGGDLQDVHSSASLFLRRGMAATAEQHATSLQFPTAEGMYYANFTDMPLDINVNPPARWFEPYSSDSHQAAARLQGPSTDKRRAFWEAEALAGVLDAGQVWMGMAAEGVKGRMRGANADSCAVFRESNGTATMGERERETHSKICGELNEFPENEIDDGGDSANGSHSGGKDHFVMQKIEKPSWTVVDDENSLSPFEQFGAYEFAEDEESFWPHGEPPTVYRNGTTRGLEESSGTYIPSSEPLDLLYIFLFGCPNYLIGTQLVAACEGDKLLSFQIYTVWDPLPSANFDASPRSEGPANTQAVQGMTSTDLTRLRALQDDEVEELPVVKKYEVPLWGLPDPLFKFVANRAEGDVQSYPLFSSQFAGKISDASDAPPSETNRVIRASDNFCTCLEVRSLMSSGGMRISFTTIIPKSIASADNLRAVKTGNSQFRFDYGSAESSCPDGDSEPGIPYLCVRMNRYDVNGRALDAVEDILDGGECVEYFSSPTVCDDPFPSTLPSENSSNNVCVPLIPEDENPSDVVESQLMHGEDVIEEKLASLWSQVLLESEPREEDAIGTFYDVNSVRVRGSLPPSWSVTPGYHALSWNIVKTEPICSSSSNAETEPSTALPDSPSVRSGAASLDSPSDSRKLQGEDETVEVNVEIAMSRDCNHSVCSGHGECRVVNLLLDWSRFYCRCELGWGGPNCDIRTSSTAQSRLDFLTFSNFAGILGPLYLLGLLIAIWVRHCQASRRKAWRQANADFASSLAATHSGEKLVDDDPITFGSTGILTPRNSASSAPTHYVELAENPRWQFATEMSNCQLAWYAIFLAILLSVAAAMSAVYHQCDAGNWCPLYDKIEAYRAYSVEFLTEPSDWQKTFFLTDSSLSEPVALSRVGKNTLYPPQVERGILTSHLVGFWTLPASLSSSGLPLAEQRLLRNSEFRNLSPYLNGTSAPSSHLRPHESFPFLTGAEVGGKLRGAASINSWRRLVPTFSASTSGWEVTADQNFPWTRDFTKGLWQREHYKSAFVVMQMLDFFFAFCAIGCVVVTVFQGTLIITCVLFSFIILVTLVLFLFFPATESAIPVVGCVLTYAVVLIPRVTYWLTFDPRFRRGIKRLKLHLELSVSKGFALWTVDQPDVSKRVSLCPDLYAPEDEEPSSVALDEMPDDEDELLPVPPEFPKASADNDDEPLPSPLAPVCCDPWTWSMSQCVGSDEITLQEKQRQFNESLGIESVPPPEYVQPKDRCCACWRHQSVRRFILRVRMLEKLRFRSFVALWLGNFACIIGTVSFFLSDTGMGYWIYHSVWHICIFGSTIFFFWAVFGTPWLPPATRVPDKLVYRVRQVKRES